MKFFYDYTITSKNPYQTGIQRVVKNIISESTKNDEIKTEILILDDLFRKDKKVNKYIRIPHFVAHSLNIILKKIGIHNRINLFFHYFNLIKFFRNNDVRDSYFINIDANWSDLNLMFLKFFRKNGGKVISIYYDNGPYLYPNFFHKYLVKNYINYWNKAFFLSDQIICISKTIALELKTLISNYPALYTQIPSIDYFYLGANFNNQESFGLFEINPIKKNYIVVGSIEPRKNNHLIYESFNEIFKNSKYRNQINLIFIYHNTWHSELLLKKIKKNKFFNKNIFLLNDVNDRELTYFYNSSYALINASLYEGFGLGISEALNYNLKTFCNNIPVFHEIFGKSVIYFNNDKSSFIKTIIDDFEKPFNCYKYRSITWRKSFNMLLNKINIV